MTSAKQAFNNKEYDVALRLWEIDLKQGKDTRLLCLNTSFKLARQVLIPRKEYLEAITYLNKALDYALTDETLINKITIVKIACLYELVKVEIPKALSFLEAGLLLNPPTFLKTKLNEKISRCNELLLIIRKTIDDYEQTLDLL